MNFKKSLLVGCLTTLLGIGAAVGAAASAEKAPAKEAKANNSSVTLYCSILSSTLGSYEMYASAQLGTDEYTDNFKMTEVENGITTSGRKVFVVTITEKYGGFDKLWFKYLDGSTEKSYKEAFNSWHTKDSINNKVFNYEAATGADWASYSIPTGHYSLIGSESSWATDRDLTSSGEGVYSITRSFGRGETFKIRSNHCWYSSYGFQNVTGTASGAFQDSDGDVGNNFKCVLSGTYQLQFTPASSSFVINYTTDETYSYVLTLWSNYSCGYLYNSNSDKYSEWASAPAVSSLGGGQAYDVKVGYGSKGYYGLYKVSDRYLSSFSYLILKKSGDVSGTYDNQSDTFTVSGTEKIYVSANDGSPTVLAKTSALYKAAAFIYDLVANRGGATYDNHHFDYSICATSKATAQGLISRYDTLNADSDVSAIFAASTYESYDLSGEYSESSKTNYSIAQIIDALHLIVIKDGQSNRISVFLSNEAASSYAWLIVIAAVSIAGFGAFFFIKRRKEDR